MLKKIFLQIFIFAAAFACAQDIIWETGAWDANTPPAEDNLILGMDGGFTDGILSPFRNNGPTISSNALKVYNFDSPVAISEVRIYATWVDSGRDQVSVESVTVTDINNVETVISPSSVTYQNTRANYAILKKVGGGAIASGVMKIAIQFGVQENGFVGYEEIEVVRATYSADFFSIESADDMGFSSPGYAVYSGYKLGDELEVTVSADDIAAKGKLVHCLGWQLFEWDSANNDFALIEESTEENRYHFTGTHTGEMLKLVWFWECLGEAPLPTLYVSPEGSDASGDGSLENPFATISKAMDHSEVPGCVIIQPGEYRISRTLEITKSIIVAGATGNARDVVINANKSCRAVQITANATLQGVVISNGYVNAANAPAAGIMMYQGTVTNCIITHCQSAATFATGGGVNLSGVGALLIDSRVTQCSAGRQGYGSGVYNYNGRVIGCVIDGNRPGSLTTVANIFEGIGLYQTGEDAFTDRCIITNNSAPYIHLNHNCTAGALITHGILRNTLLADNNLGEASEGTSTSQLSSSGLWLSGADAKAQNCTIVNNMIAAQKGGGGVRVTSGEVVNCIIIDNFNSTLNAEINYNSPPSGTWRNNCSTGASLLNDHGSGNIECETMTFKSGSYELLDSSLAVGVGSVEAWMREEGALDLAKSPRLWEDSDGTLRADIGAYTFKRSAFACRIHTDAPSINFDRFEGSFTSELFGDEEGTVYHWDIDGDGESEYSGSDLSSISFNRTELGDFSVTLYVTNGIGQSAQSSSLPFKLFSAHVYVNINAQNPVYPYSTPETATASLLEAFELSEQAAGITVHIADGEYPITSGIHLKKRVSIVGESPERTVIKGAGNHRLFRISGAFSEIRNLCLTNGYAAVAVLAGERADIGGCLYIEDSVLAENLRVIGTGSARPSIGTGIACINGTIRNCRIEHCRSIYPENAVETGAGITRGVGIFVDGSDALVEDCIIDSCIALGTNVHSQNPNATGVYMLGGTMRNCLVTRNQNIRSKNTATMSEAHQRTAGVYMEGGKLVNCTIANNHATQTTAGLWISNKANTTVKNCIIWDNRRYTDFELGGEWTPGNYSTGAASKISYSCTTPALSDPHSIALDPRFNDPENGDWRLISALSPCVNKGLNEAFENLGGANDLKGNARLIRSTIDMGCYEAPSAATLFLLR